MANGLRSLTRYCPTGTAEGEADILEEIFIYDPGFETIFSPPPGSPHLLIGKKGSGKSAILNFAERLNRAQDVPCVTLKPLDIPFANKDANVAVGELTAEFRSTLLLSVATRIVSEMSGLISGADADLYNACISAGTVKPDAIGKLARSLAGIAKPVTKIDLTQAFPALPPRTSESIAEGISKSLGKKRFALFIDDTDQVANPGVSGHLNRIWSLILAVRSITQTVPEISAVITMRTEVWRRLQRDAGGQRDQVDHFHNLCTYINPGREQITRIVERRLLISKVDAKCASDMYDCFFEGQGAHAPQSKQFRSWKDLIVVRSRERPRDAIQLLNSLSRRALGSQKPKIDEETFQGVMPEFSAGRAALIAQELADECPQTAEILDSFATIWFDEGGFKAGADGLLEHLKKLPSIFRLSLFGEILQPDNRAHAFYLWDFLYQNGIINARIADAREPDGYRHLFPSEEPNVVAETRWNEMQKLLWEIHPAYRDHLISVQSKRLAQTGLPPARPRKRRKR